MARRAVRVMVVVAVWALVMAGGSVFAADAADAPETAAAKDAVFVEPIAPSPEVPASTAAALSRALESELSRGLPSLTLITARSMDGALLAQELEQCGEAEFASGQGCGAGLTDRAHVLYLARAGAGYVGRRFTLSVTLVDVKSGAVVGQGTTSVPRHDVGAVFAKLPELVAQAAAPTGKYAPPDSAPDGGGMAPLPLWSGVTLVSLGGVLAGTAGVFAMLRSQGVLDANMATITEIATAEKAPIAYIAAGGLVAAGAACWVAGGYGMWQDAQE